MRTTSLSAAILTVCLFCLVSCGKAQAQHRWVAVWDAEKGPDNLSVVSTVTDGIPDYVEIAGRKAVTTK
ncbi:MAG: hypothetical protein QUS09_08355, partial [Methanotrichaceae archaeon]|nr:hypothetical protein [Methanotrichaceae archaeon]